MYNPIKHNNLSRPKPSSDGLYDRNSNGSVTECNSC